MGISVDASGRQPDAELRRRFSDRAMHIATTEQISWVEIDEIIEGDITLQLPLYVLQNLSVPLPDGCVVKESGDCLGTHGECVPLVGITWAGKARIAGVVWCTTEPPLMENRIDWCISLLFLEEAPLPAECLHWLVRVKKYVPAADDGGAEARPTRPTLLLSTNASSFRYKYVADVVDGLHRLRSMEMPSLMVNDGYLGHQFIARKAADTGRLLRHEQARIERAAVGRYTSSDQQEIFDWLREQLWGLPKADFGGIIGRILAAGAQPMFSLDGLVIGLPDGRIAVCYYADVLLATGWLTTALELAPDETTSRRLSELMFPEKVLGDPQWRARTPDPFSTDWRRYHRKVFALVGRTVSDRQPSAMAHFIANCRPSAGHSPTTMTTMAELALRANGGYLFKPNESRHEPVVDAQWLFCMDGYPDGGTAVALPAGVAVSAADLFLQMMSLQPWRFLARHAAWPPRSWADGVEGVGDDLGLGASRVIRKLPDPWVDLWFLKQSNQDIASLGVKPGNTVSEAILDEYESHVRDIESTIRTRLTATTMLQWNHAEALLANHLACSMAACRTCRRFNHDGSLCAVRGRIIDEPDVTACFSYEGSGMREEGLWGDDPGYLVDPDDLPANWFALGPHTDETRMIRRRAGLPGFEMI